MYTSCIYLCAQTVHQEVYLVPWQAIHNALALVLEINGTPGSNFVQDIVYCLWWQQTASVKTTFNNFKFPKLIYSGIGDNGYI